MHSLRGNGDSIAAEFAKLIRKNAPEPVVKKVAQDLSAADAAEGQAVNNAEDEDLANDISEAINVDEVGASTDLAQDALTDDINSLKSYSREEYILNGLSKIASSLRGKGEGFAADVVMATANDISKDFKKEAGRKNHIVSSLSKIASDLSRKGDEFASDLVKATINKIR